MLVNTRDFERVAKENSNYLTARKLVLPIESFGLNEIDDSKYLNYKLRRKMRNFKILNKAFNNNKKFNVMSDKTFEIDSLKEKNYLIGHWQDLKILDENRNYLIDSMSNNLQLKSAINKPKDDITLIHVRRGDYLKFGEELPLSYYEKSINLIKDKSEVFKFKVYTDDIQWCKNQIIFSSAEDILTSSDSPEDTVNTFSSMLQNKHFIIANSTFSLLAAYFGKRKDSIITYPEPWFRSRNYNKNIVDVNWERVTY